MKIDCNDLTMETVGDLQLFASRVHEGYMSTVGNTVECAVFSEEVQLIIEETAAKLGLGLTGVPGDDVRLTGDQLVLARALLARFC